MKESISSLRTTFRQEMSTKLDVIQANQKQMETGLTTFDLSVTSVINEIKEEGTKIKVMVDRHIEKMIATLREKAQHEKRTAYEDIDGLQTAAGESKGDRKKGRQNTTIQR
jgi:hypothetical protein